MQQAQIVQRWLIYGVKCREKHVCGIDASRERKCMRSNVARPTKGRGKLQNRTTARYKFVHGTITKREFRFLYKAWAKVANLHTACLGIEISLPVKYVTLKFITNTEFSSSTVFLIWTVVDWSYESKITWNLLPLQQCLNESSTHVGNQCSFRSRTAAAKR